MLYLKLLIDFNIFQSTTKIPSCKNHNIKIVLYIKRTSVGVFLYFHLCVGR